jgi:hypothetical protein
MARYEKDGKKYVSVTQLIDIFFPFNEKGFNAWCKSQKLDPEKIGTDSSRMGTKVSEWIQNHTLGVPWLDSPATIEAEEGLKEAAIRFLEENWVLACEKTVYCDEFEYAGTLDMMVETPGGLAIWDAKTFGAWKGDYKRDSGKIKKVQWQTSMYSYATGGQHPLAVVVFKTDGSYEVEELVYTDAWKEKIEEHKKEINLLRNK